MTQITTIPMPRWGLSMREGKLAVWHASEGGQITPRDEDAGPADQFADLPMGRIRYAERTGPDADTGAGGCTPLLLIRGFGGKRINVNAICPGVVATNMWKLIDKGFKDEGLTSRDNEAFEGSSADILLGRPSRADDLMGVSVFLASSGSDYMTGQSLLVDGGMVLI